MLDEDKDDIHGQMLNIKKLLFGSYFRMASSDQKLTAGAAVPFSSTCSQACRLGSVPGVVNFELSGSKVLAGLRGFHALQSGLTSWLALVSQMPTLAHVQPAACPPLSTHSF